PRRLVAVAPFADAGCFSWPHVLHQGAAADHEMPREVRCLAPPCLFRGSNPQLRSALLLQIMLDMRLACKSTVDRDSSETPGDLYL
uniref:Uncharacterized protein n=1 Tax=Triticum urartu TaxID=4572 RepID=A0A8R7R3P2_TRIUA